jgi:hypothetical protein
MKEKPITRPALRTADKEAAKAESKLAANSKIEYLEKVVEHLLKKVDAITDENIKLTTSLKNLRATTNKGFKVLDKLIKKKRA